jgi:hypothetical protein
LPESKSHKQLPSWLREGLEKIKQEKQKKIETSSNPASSPTTASKAKANDTASPQTNSAGPLKIVNETTKSLL